MHTINRRTLIIAGIAVAAVVIIGVGVFLAREALWPSPQEVAFGKPVDIVLDFYTPWLAAVHATTTDPYTEGLAKSPILSKELRKRIQNEKGQADGSLDPVLCQTNIPMQISARPISQIDGKAQVLVVSRDKGQTAQAIIDLIALNEGWYIDNITCSPGEFGPEREFSFDREGHLLKTVPPPLNPEYWHIVFVENNMPGHVAPLFFSTESVCTTLKGDSGACDPSIFVPASKAHVQGEMTETGINVKRLTLLPE
jgi:hypothetical protein